MKASHHRRDGNHQVIADALVRCGWRVRSLSMVGYGMPDLIIFRGGVLRLVEIKEPKGKLRPKQIEFVAEGWPVVTVRTVEDAQALT